MTLRGGTISMYAGDQVTDRLFVSGGFAEVPPERCTVLATEVLPVAEVSKAEGEKRLAAAEANDEVVAKQSNDAEDAALDAIQSARAMVEAAA